MVGVVKGASQRQAAKYQRYGYRNASVTSRRERLERVYEKLA